MRYSQLLIPTVKEVPADAEIPSHRLMIRAGYIRKVASGTYTYLPLGWRSLRKIIEIVREEMDAAGAQEILMPIVQPMELWQKTGRDVVFRDIMGRFTDRHGRENVLAPTAEEVVTSLAAAEISSYKQLPINLYQINTKFRDEFRPRFGVLRSREFLMKDAYSFDAVVDGLDETYRKMYEAYCRIFDRCGLQYLVVEAESGGMGGTDTEEFMIPCDAGEDVIVTTENGPYAANLERAEVDSPGATGSKLQTAPEMEEVHTPNTGTIEQVCSFLGTKPHEMIKTLIYAAARELGDEPPAEKTDQDGRHGTAGQACEGQVFVVIVRGDHDVNEAKLNHIVGMEAELATADCIETYTGAATGFAGPVGLKVEPDKTIIDPWVAAMGMGVAGANRTDYHVKNVVPGRDFPLEGDGIVVADVRNAVEGDTLNGRPLRFSRGVEVGHVFKLGTKYSRQLGAMFLDEKGNENPCIMGCYGIGINRILASAIELGNDENGCVLPVNIAPFEVVLLPLNNDSEAVMDVTEKIYDELRSAGTDVLLDERPVRPGVKFNDADLIGIPLRVVVGRRGLKEGNVEIKRRSDAEATLVPVGDAVAQVQEILDEMRSG